MKKLIQTTIICILIFTTYYFGKNEIVYRYGNAIERDTIIKIYPYDSFNVMIDNLDKTNILNKRLVHSMAKYHESNYLRAGNYNLKKGMKYRQFLNALNKGHETPIKVTFNNIRTPENLAGKISKYILADSLSILKTLYDTSFIASLGFTQATFPAMFIPNTYEAYWTDSPKEFVLRMKQEYEAFWTVQRKEKANKLGYTPVEISIIASIVDEETEAFEEMSDVAGVYINRLKRNMPLQADPTVKFAIGNFTLQRILYRHLNYKSPYNTYKIKGLPPGPICIPSIETIEATLNYEGHKYYFFCADAELTGRHSFARTFVEHTKNARAYQNKLDELNIR